MGIDRGYRGAPCFPNFSDKVRTRDKYIANVRHPARDTKQAAKGGASSSLQSLLFLLSLLPLLLSSASFAELAFNALRVRHWNCRSNGEERGQESEKVCIFAMTSMRHFCCAMTTTLSAAGES